MPEGPSPKTTLLPTGESCVRSRPIIGLTTMAQVVEILTSSSPASEMQSKPSGHAIPGKGLEGDRYCLGIGTFSKHPQKPDYEITLIEKEMVEAFAKETGLPFTTLRARRNIVTEGISLNELVGKEFMVGKVCLRGIRLCEPCNYLAKSTFPEVLAGLVHKAGLRAQIVSEGTLRVGDPITVRTLDVSETGGV